MNLRRTFFFFCFLLISCAAVLRAAELSTETTYLSMEEFMTAAKELRPSKVKGEFQKLLSIPELGEMAPGQVREVRIADAVQGCEEVWRGDEAALVFVTARPPTEATLTEVGLLIYVERSAVGWKIIDVMRFTALGKYAKITAELTAGTGSGYSLGTESSSPIVTIKEFQGGRGYYYDLSASYTIDAHKIKRRDLK